MIVTAELSLYPLRDDAIPVIKEFIHDLRRSEGIEIITNQLSTQIRGDFDAVTGAMNRGMRKVMAEEGTVIVVAKYLNVDLPIGRAPRLD